MVSCQYVVQFDSMLFCFQQKFKMEMLKHSEHNTSLVPRLPCANRMDLNVEMLSNIKILA